MAMLPTGPFNAADVPPAEDFSPIPAGEYLVMITDSDMKPTKNGSGQYLEITLQVVDGPNKGRLVWDRINLVNKSPKAVEIAQRTLSAICRAVGVPNVQDSAQLHNKPLMARVTYREAQGDYGASNEVKAYKPAGQQPAPGAAPAQQQAQPAPGAPPFVGQQGNPADAGAAADGRPVWAQTGTNG